MSLTLAATCLLQCHRSILCFLAWFFSFIVCLCLINIDLQFPVIDCGTSLKVFREHRVKCVEQKCIRNTFQSLHYQLCVILKVATGCPRDRRSGCFDVGKRERSLGSTLLPEPRAERAVTHALSKNNLSFSLRASEGGVCGVCAGGGRLEPVTGARVGRL